ncbi:hypothetical protein A1O3_08179 [Capronia epimyces CBS 606.96]|uniref:Uncharacterized protein n=1 Tax=Capronia epimyces CBS 606.96 TaxID=1182542 RepID=W9YC46_9EURO|nr:uncharacterized protein A1O3_08179 [Capronia epimyces CBS 606.96]EXJ79894.1 hypothetical protein A1O3_08179 [Capronia epimyces CBS 606.96]
MVREIPYISPTDLLVFKIFSCGLNRTSWQKDRDVHDAERLLEILADSKPLVLTTQQREAVKGVHRCGSAQ